MHDLKNLKCLLPNTEALLLQMVDKCDFLEKYVLAGGSALTLHLCHRKSEKFNLSSLESIAAMKINVLFLRAKYRDYYDIYFLVKKSMSLKKIFECSLDLLEGISFKLFSVALLYTDDIEDDNIEYLEPIEILSKEKIRDFFQFELDKSK